MGKNMLRRVLGLALCWGVLTGLAVGQGLLVNAKDGHPIRLPRPPIVWPPHPHPHPVPPSPAPPVQTYKIKSLEADMRWEDGVAKVQVTQTFVNTGSQTLEAAFVFPLPADGAIDAVTLLVDGKEFTGRVLAKDEARQIYESYVRRNRDPALLEWVGYGMFQTSVFPIPAGAERKVTISYTQVTRSVFGLSEWLMPLQPAKYTSEPIEQLRITARLSTKAPLRNIYSPTHAVDIQRPSDTSAVVTFKADHVVPNTDFRLFFDHQNEPLAANVLSYWPEGESEGYFLMLAQPPALEKSARPIPKTVVFVVDTSGSMSGKKFEQAQEALRFVLNNLQPDDLFNIVAYSDSVVTFRPELQKCDQATRDQALGFVAGLYAGGSTNISGALATGLEMLKDASRPNYVLFLTDGLPTAGETDPARIVAETKTKNAVRARMFSFGVGFDVNSRLLDTLTRVHAGMVEYVRPDENIERYVSNLYRGVASPVLTGVQIEFAGPQSDASAGPAVTRRYPDPLTDLFADQQFMLVGRYRQSGDYKVKIKGQQESTAREYQLPIKLSDKTSSSQYAFVARLWASRRIGEILDKLDVEGTNQELIDELVMLSKQHGIMTPYTAFLAEEPNVLADRGQLLSAASSSVDALRANESGRDAFYGRAVKQELKLSQAAPQAGGYGGAGYGIGGYGGAAGGRQRGAGARYGGGVPAGPLSAPAQPALQSAVATAADTELSDTVTGPAPAVLNVGTKTFYRYENQWVEEGLQAEDIAKARSIERYSDDYFDLLKRHGDDVGQYLSIDETVVLKLGEEIVKF
ncbi:MAG: VIT domain-containing protein [Pirellulales bacterium]